ncbi:MAG: tetratricopeptide repeat protein [Candidatus Nitrohelix vancouverensis]|uniref:Tetratricopeptide repeat protein n=1 Tax=Candidatus Nitrohelix vancouverensis TaxID=2705534 RepID=A0A7T0G2H3_9BACT|nr:MAG: tetratricopeptide repeat protein [Candidatus Nitrohelix vancouverensis]
MIKVLSNKLRTLLIRFTAPLLTFFQENFLPRSRAMLERLKARLFQAKKPPARKKKNGQKKKKDGDPKKVERSLSVLKGLEAELRRQLARYPHEGDYYYQLGEVLMDMHRYGEASAMLKEAVRLNTKNKSARFVLAHSYVEIGRDEDAVVLLEEELIKKPNSMAVKKMLARAHSNLSVSFGKLRRQEDAKKHFHEAIKIVPNYGPAHLSMGICYTEMGFYKEALQKFDDALALDKNLWVDSNYYCGKVYVKQGKNRKALKHFKMAISVTCKSAFPYLHLGLLYVKMKKYKDAVEPLETAYKLSPNRVPEAPYNLGWTLVQLKRYEEALEPLRTAMELTPDDENVLKMMARALYESALQCRKDKKYADEVEKLREAVRLQPDDPKIRVALGLAFDNVREGYSAIFHTIIAKQLFIQLKDVKQAGKCVKALSQFLYKYPFKPEDFSKVKAPLIRTRK